MKYFIVEEDYWSIWDYKTGNKIKSKDDRQVHDNIYKDNCVEGFEELKQAFPRYDFRKISTLELRLRCSG